jgi:hypothetical protein
MSANLAVLAYAVCGFLIVVSAWVRSIRPASVAIALLVYVALGGPLFAHFASVVHLRPSGLTMSSKIAHVQLVTIGIMVWLIVRYAFASRAAGDPPRFSGFVMNCFIMVLTGAGICFAFHVGDADPLSGAGRDLWVILFSFPLCVAAAFFRDHRVEGAKLPAWLRLGETWGCTSVMALGLASLYLGESFPFPTDTLQGWRLAAMLAFPSVMALVIGGCVPYFDRVEGIGPRG